MSTEVIENEVENEVVDDSQGAELTLLQFQKLEVVEQLDAIYPKLREADNLVQSLKADTKEAKATLEKIQGQAAQLIRRLYELEHGGQQHLPFENEEIPHPDVEAGKNRPHGTPLLEAAAKAMREDPGIKAPISVLGMTEKETELLVTAEINTVAELESRMRSDEWWHKKVKGFGPTKVDKLSDCLLSWRMKNPIPDEDDDDEPLEVEAAEEEPDTVPFAKELQWWCSECQHEWPVDGENDQCPECENETGNYQFGEFSCPDANAMGVIFRNYEEVQVIDDEGVKCLVQVYEVPDGGWTSCIDIQDSETPYMYSNSMNIEDYTSTSRDAAIWNQLSKILGSDDAPESVLEDIETYIELHLSTLNVTCNELYCINCESQYMFDIDNVDSPFCPFCGAAEHTPAE